MAKTMTKSAIIGHLAQKSNLSKKQVVELMDQLLSLATKEAKNVFVVPGIETTALSSAGSAEIAGAGADPAGGGGGGGVYAHSGRPAGMGPVGAGAACCCAMIDAPKITTAIAIGAPTDLAMFLSIICG